VSTPFEEYGRLLRDQVSAVIEAELLLDPVRAETYEELLHRCLVEPQPIGCQPATPERDPSPAAMVPLWLVLQEPPARGDRYFIAFDPERRCFGLGVREGATAWYLGGCGSFLDMVERL
jgi:hypothetical protein